MPSRVCADDFHYLSLLHDVIPLAFDRCCGLVARIRGFQSLLLRVLGQESCSSIGTSPSTSRRAFLFCFHTPDGLDHRLTCARIHSQVHLDDDSVLSVVTYAVDHLKVKHGRFTLVSQV